MAEGYPIRNKTTPLIPEPPKGLKYTQEDEIRYDEYIKKAYKGHPVLNKNDFLRQFHR